VKDIWDALENEGHGERLEEEMFAFLSAYADGENDARERRLVEAYLREEPDAERLLGFIRSTDAALAADTAEPPSGLREAIFARTTRKPALWRGWVGRTAAAAGAAAALMAVVWSLRSDAPRSEIASLTAPPVSRGTEEPALEQPTVGSEAPTEPIAGDEVPISSARHEPAPRPGAGEIRQGREHQSELADTRPPGGAGGRGVILASNPTGNRVPPTPASFERPTPTVYSSEEPVTVRAEPKPIDPMAMEQPSPEDRRVAAGGGSSGGAKEKPPVLPDAREKLREALQKANEERDDLNDSSLNAPRKKSGNDRGVTQ